MRPPIESFADHEQAANQRAVAGRLIGEARPYWRQWLLVLALVLMSAVAQAGAPWLIGRAVDDAIVAGNRHELTLLMLPLLGLYLMGALAMRGQIRIVGRVGQSLLASLRGRLFDRFLRVPLRFFDRQPIGDLMSRVINDVETLNQFFSQILSQTLGSIFALIGVIVAMLLLDWRLALVSFAVIPIMLVTTSYFGRRARVVYRRARETTGDVTAGLQEEIAGVREAQAFNRTGQNISRFRERNAANRDANVQAVGVSSAFAPAIDILSTLAVAVVIAYGGYLVVHDALTVGVLTAFVLYVQQFFRPLQMLSTMYAQVQAGLAGAERIYTVLDEPAEPADAATAIALDTLRGEIEFRHVRFGYETGRDVLHDVSFRVAAGQTVALVGRTGAGKTTIANLIPRFYDVDDGALRIDGHDVREITRESLRAGIAVVLQEPFLFAGTIADNIAYGRPDAPRAEIEAAAEATGAATFIAMLPDGYETVLGEGGGNVSRGQRQLLTFARAILADPRILILDEATSNVDTRTERVIQQALTQLMAGRTSIVIAHRLSTIRTADLILVIEDGRIVEQGSHAGLLAEGGAYAALYRHQFRDEPTAVAAD
ncbi:MAG TPA: ABC transporter ATP-binding protein [Thermomicrobiales bacterium]|nr:ABC transporter ATP-binding protein [Chloroflexota bacterium]HCG28334.1 ABC transporter ATP-binding protein [Chloroflexota bacterium]HQZ90962.1 ABC transporter ATP-binding protein [Thermomicrobiales bacterium]HRA32699.1 ABC transporter ATP-binding protein [Thermomicrobiales bacterium]